MRPRAGRVMSPDAAVAFATRIRESGGTVVFTTGAFDILHAGHIRFLQRARALGTALIVGVDPDAAVRAERGATRPLNPQRERAELLVALEAVNAAFPLDAADPDIVRRLQPDVIVRGTEDDRPSGHAAPEPALPHVCRVVHLERTAGISATGIIDKARRLR